MDLFFDYFGIESALVERSQSLTLVAGLEAPVVGRGDLLALKILAGRPRDLEDARALARRSSDADLAAARAALREIEHAGVHAALDRLSALDRLVGEARNETFRG